MKDGGRKNSEGKSQGNKLPSKSSKKQTSRPFCATLLKNEPHERRHPLQCVHSLFVEALVEPETKKAKP